VAHPWSLWRLQAVALQTLRQVILGIMTLTHWQSCPRAWWERFKDSRRQRQKQSVQAVKFSGKLSAKTALS
jgi:hypothetical protein